MMNIVVSLRPAKIDNFPHGSVAEYFDNVPQTEVLSAHHAHIATISVPPKRLEQLMPELEKLFLVKRLRGYRLL